MTTDRLFALPALGMNNYLVVAFADVAENTCVG